GGLAQADRELLQHNLRETIESVHHLLEGADHAARERALNLLDQLEASFEGCLAKADITADSECWHEGEAFITGLRKTGIEGLRGWGEAPGRVMVWNNELLLPGLQFGNIFIGPQPPRGWELNEELLHANTRFPPPHQYVAFYHFLKSEFKADALVHLGRHSTYEFLPRKRTGLSAEDYATGLIADLPSIYPYIVDGVGEGIQAKRRGSAVMIDHLTPPLIATPLYDDLLALRQL
ncbi:cobaltochelatase subunit CobN, partial [Oceanospirillum sp. HFRX-1_2]